jgi:hypothetical protein
VGVEGVRGVVLIIYTFFSSSGLALAVQRPEAEEDNEEFFDCFVDGAKESDKSNPDRPNDRWCLARRQKIVVVCCLRTLCANGEAASSSALLEEEEQARWRAPPSTSYSIKVFICPHNVE